MRRIDFGARTYNASIGRFDRVDRFADKYFELSPFQYVANNPVKFIDINGDSLFINYMDANGVAQRVHYGYTEQGGYGFYNSNGTAYSGGNTFIDQVSDALARIGLGKEGRQMIDFLSGNKNMSEIVQRSSNGAELTAGSYVKWNPSGNTSAPDVNGSITRPTYIGLAHELAHVEDIWNNTVNTNPWYSVTDPNGNVKSVPNAEIYSTFRENMFRSENNLPLRAYYGLDTFGNGDPNSKIINTTTGESLYYEINKKTTFSPLNKNQKPYKF